MFHKNKRKLYRLFENVNSVKLNEFYGDDVDFNIENKKNVRELHVLLSSGGIPDIEKEYPEWVVDRLISDKFIEKDDRSITWVFTENGTNKFSNPNDLQNWLFSIERESGNDVEDDIPLDGMPTDTEDVNSDAAGEDFDQLNEGALNDEDKQVIIDEFIQYTNGHLGLDNDTPDVTISQDPNEAAEMFSFGKFTPHDGKILIVATNRNLADVLRTLAHEMVHFKQHIEDRLDNNSGGDGSEIENEANAEAAVIMRQFGRNNPKIYE